LERLLRDEGVEMVPRLSQLRIYGVKNLKVPHLPCVEEVDARRVEAATSFMEGVGENMSCLKTLSISLIKGGKVLPDQLSRLGALEFLEIRYWDDVEYFPEHVLEGLTSLRTLSIYYCEKLKSLSEGVRHLGCLETLVIDGCRELVALPNNMSQLTALRTVAICHRSTLPYGSQCVPSLRKLDIICCNFSSLPEWMGDMTSLQELYVWQCGELRSLPSSIQRLTNLSKLIIGGCPHVEKRCKRETGEDWQYIKHIPQIEIVSCALPEKRSLRFCCK